MASLSASPLLGSSPDPRALRLDKLKIALVKFVSSHPQRPSELTDEQISKCAHTEAMGEILGHRSCYTPITALCLLFYEKNRFTVRYYCTFQQQRKEYRANGYQGVDLDLQDIVSLMASNCKGGVPRAAYCELLSESFGYLYRVDTTRPYRLIAGSTYEIRSTAWCSIL